MEMSPRVELTAVPYAYRAQTVEEDAIGTFQIEDGSITLPKINTEDAGNEQILRYDGVEDELIWSDDWIGGGSGDFSLPFHDTVNFPDNAFWIVQEGGGSTAKFDMNNIGSSGHALEATSNGQAATIFVKNTNETASGATGIYGLTEGIAPALRFINSGKGSSALFEKKLDGDAVVQINSFGTADHALNIYDTLGNNSTVNILQAGEDNLRQTLLVTGWYEIIPIL